MSKENVKKFYESTKEDKEINKELLEVTVAGNIVEFAKKKGFEFTKAEHDEFIAQITVEGTGELADDQLDKVAGGFHIPGCDQVKITCRKCGWDTGWMDIISYKGLGIVTAVHYATTGHNSYYSSYKR